MRNPCVSQHGIDVSRQRKGTVVSVQTTRYSYRFTIIDPAARLVEVTTDDPRVPDKTLGIYERGFYDEGQEVAVANWIGPVLRMQLRFRNGRLLTMPALRAEVSGVRGRTEWSYVVFDTEALVP